MLAPEHDAYDEEFSIRHNIRREFAEELFRLEAPKADEPIWFEQTAPVRDLDRMLAAGEAELWVTGVVVNVLTLRPEICALLLIADERWYSRSVDPASGARLRVNAEFATPEELSRVPADQPGPGKNVRFSPEMSDDELLARSFMSPNNSVPVGAAAFWLGIDVLRWRIGGAVQGPLSF